MVIKDFKDIHFIMGKFIIMDINYFVLVRQLLFVDISLANLLFPLLVQYIINMN